MTKLRWTPTPFVVGTLPAYVAECRLGEYMVVPDFEGYLVMAFPPNSDRKQPTWEAGPFPTGKIAKAFAQKYEDIPGSAVARGSSPAG